MDAHAASAITWRPAPEVVGASHKVRQARIATLALVQPLPLLYPLPRLLVHGCKGSGSLTSRRAFSLVSC